MVKIEYDGDDMSTHQVLQVGPNQLWEHSVTESNLLIKKEYHPVMKTEDKTYEVAIKQELEVGTVVLQPNVTCSLTTPTLVSTHWTHSQSQAERPELCPGTSAADGDAPTLSCLALSHEDRAPQSELDYGNTRSGSGYMSATGFVIEVPIVNAYKEHSHGSSDNEHTLMSAQDGSESGNYGLSQPGFDCTAGATKLMQTNSQWDKRLCNSKVRNSRTPKQPHTDEKLCKCEHCEYTTNKVRNLKKHMRSHVEVKPYKCGQCEFSASRKFNLISHQRTHTGEKPYKCELCDYRTPRLDNLKSHMHTHTGERLYKCEHCERTTARKNDLKIHTRTHTGEKPYKCEHCEYSTSRSNSLTRHMRTHTGEKPYKCEHCEYSASEPGHLKRHMRVHTGEKPYRCGQCEYSASHRKSLKTHMNIHMGNT